MKHFITWVWQKSIGHCSGPVKVMSRSGKRPGTRELWANEWFSTEGATSSVMWIQRKWDRSYVDLWLLICTSRKGCGFEEYLFTLSHHKAVGVELVNDGSYRQLRSRTIHRGLSWLPNDISAPTKPEELLVFHSMGVVSTAVKNKSLIISELYLIGRRTSLLLELVPRTWGVLLEKVSMHRSQMPLPRPCRAMRCKLIFRGFWSL